ncbi:MAG: hypothetical protein PHX27_01320 [Candidatus ainarchaeum sp.]|nr:hypothetical protein [Candidatus ainarchaeum sp.]
MDYLIHLIDFSFYNSFLAFITGSYLGFFVTGNIILVNGSKFIIDNACTGFVSIAMLAGITFPLKTDFLIKLKFFIFSTLLLLIINIFRIIFILISGLIGFNVELIHVLTWFIMSGIVLWLWLNIGLKKMFNKKEIIDLI